MLQIGSLILRMRIMSFRKPYFILPEHSIHEIRKCTGKNYNVAMMLHHGNG